MEQIPGDLVFRDETGKTVHLERLLWPEANDLEPGLLPLSDALRRGAERTLQRLEGAEI